MKRLFVSACLLVAMSATTMAQTEAESLSFLYKSMSTPDRVDYPKAYWQKQARMALKARATTTASRCGTPGRAITTS